MIRKFVVTAALLSTLAFAQTQKKPPNPQTYSAGTAISAEDVQALHEDLQRMKSLVQQMQSNLAFVTSIQGPLKHQFELEIEMWQLEIARTERHLNGSAETK